MSSSPHLYRNPMNSMPLVTSAATVAIRLAKVSL